MNAEVVLLWMLGSYLSINCENINLAFSQDDYDVKMEILECSWHNKSVVQNPIFRLAFHNRTHKVINSSLYQLLDLSNKIVISVQMYKLMSNEYRFFPLTFSVNACAEFIRDSFGVRTVLEQASNIKPCNSKKGLYYTYNLLPDFSTFPPHLPRGRFKLSVSFSYSTYKYLKCNLYFEVVDKASKWKPVSKSVPNVG